MNRSGFLKSALLAPFAAVAVLQAPQNETAYDDVWRFKQRFVVNETDYSGRVTKKEFNEMLAPRLRQVWFEEFEAASKLRNGAIL